MNTSYPLHISLVTETYPPEVNGVAMTLGKLATGLAARGHRLRIVRPRQKHERTGLQADGQLLTPGLPIPGYPELRFGLPVTDSLWQHWRQQTPDVVHIATEGPLGFAALNAARKLGIPAISTFHTNFHSYSRHYGIGWLQGSIARYLRWFHNRTATTLVPTAALAAELQQHGFREVGVLSRGVDVQLFNPGRRDSVLRSEWGAGDKDLVVMIVSRIAPEKNLGLAIEAFERIRANQPTARMVCVGDGPIREALMRRHPEVRFVGTKHDVELARHYASADLFLFPSLTETFGNVVSEALASGLPVVAFDYAAASSLIKNGINGQRVDRGDDAGFIAAAEALARDLPDHPRWRNAGPASIAHLNWERALDSYETTLRDKALRAQYWPDERYLVLLPD